jgi:ornithine cyclodeaminase
VYDIDKEISESFKTTAKKFLGNIDVLIGSDAEQVARKSDILVTLTTKQRDTPPLILDKWVGLGTHINAVGGDSSRQIELEKSLIQRAKLVVDFREDAIHEGESHQVGQEKIYADLSELVTNAKEGRVNDKEVTIFDSVGFGMLDLQTYKLIYKLASEENLLRKKMNVVGRPKNSKNFYESYFL